MWGIFPHTVIIVLNGVISTRGEPFMDKIQTILISTIIILILGLGLVYLITPQETQQEKITLAINPFPLSALVFIAEENGYFANEGLEIEFVNFQTGKMALDAFIGGGSEFATTADIPIMLAGLNDQKFSTIATIANSQKDIWVVARKDSGINVPEDLRGKKIATTSGGGPLYFTHKFLERHNIELSEVKLTNLSPSDMIFAIVKGDIDAMIIFGPHHLIAKNQLGDNAIVFAPNDLYGEAWNIVVDSKYAEENPEKVNAFLKALLKAEEFVKNNKARAISITADYSGVEKNLFDGYWELIDIEMVLSEDLILTLESEAEWAIEQGINDRESIPNYRELIDSSFLSNINPESVTVK